MRQENAQRRKQGLESKGFNPMIRIQRQAEPRYWLDYEQNPGSALIALDMQNRPNDFMQRPLPCPDTDFFEAEVVASQDPGENPAELEASEEEGKVVSVGDEDADMSSSFESLAPPQAGNTPDNSVETPADQDADNTSEVAVAALPKPAVGTGPEHTLLTEPVQLKDSAPNQAIAGEEKSTDGGSGNTPKKEVEALPEQAVPQKTETDGGNGGGVG
jgi:hypothetical protein